MDFWKEHSALRAALILALFVIGLALVLWGWSITGKLGGLMIMLCGVAALLCALLVYNKPYK